MSVIHTSELQDKNGKVIRFIDQEARNKIDQFAEEAPKVEQDEEAHFILDETDIDTTLSKEGKIAEAAAVGKAIGQLSEELSEESNSILAGKSLENSEFSWTEGSIVSTGGDAKPSNDAYPYSWRSTGKFIGTDKKYYFKSTHPTAEIRFFRYDMNGVFIERTGSSLSARVLSFTFASEYRYKIMYYDTAETERPPLDTLEIYIPKEIEYVPEVVSREIGEKVNELREEITKRIPNEYNDTLYLASKTIPIRNPFKGLGENQYKGQMHAHHISGENYDNVAWTVQEFVDAHASAGYDFVTLTDYQMVGSISQKAEDMKGMVWLCNSTEEAVVKNTTEGTPTTHICTYFVDSLMESFTSVKDALKAFAQAGRISSLAHPMLNGKDWTSAQIVDNITDCTFVEVWNGLGDDHEKRGDDWIIDKYADYTDYAFDLMLSLGMDVYCTAVSDIHGESDSIINNGYVKVFADNKNRMEIWDALLSGRFYSSNGAVINSVSLTDDTLSVSVENGATIEFVGENGVVLKTVSGNSGTYTFSGDEKYVRIRATDANGYKAWTQAVVLDA